MFWLLSFLCTIFVFVNKLKKLYPLLVHSLVTFELTIKICRPAPDTGDCTSTTARRWLHCTRCCSSTTTISSGSQALYRVSSSCTPAASTIFGRLIPISEAGRKFFLPCGLMRPDNRIMLVVISTSCALTPSIHRPIFPSCHFPHALRFIQYINAQNFTKQHQHVTHFTIIVSFNVFSVSSPRH